MRRRDALAGLASAGVLVGGGAVMVRGLPSFATGAASNPDDGADDGDEADDEAAVGGGIEDDGSVAVETVEAPGSDGELVRVPGDAPATLVEFFVTGCGNCQAQMPRLAEARERIDDEVQFLSVTYQAPDAVPPADLADWWDRHGGTWPVGYDPTPGLASQYGVVGYPVAMVVDGDGENRWQEIGVKEPEAFVDAVESVLDG